MSKRLGLLAALVLLAQGAAAQTTVHIPVPASSVTAPAQTIPAQTIAVPASSVDVILTLNGLPAGCSVVWSGIGATITATIGGCTAPASCPAGFVCTPVTPPPPPPPPPSGVVGWLGADALTGTLAIGSTVTVNSHAGPLRSAASGAAVAVSPQPSPLVGAQATIVGGPTTAGIVWWQVQFAASAGGTTPPPPPPPTGALAAFPGAQGGGAGAAGGRGGAVFEVTNLNDSGSGSLRACVQATGARTCVCPNISGRIVVQSPMRASSPFLTVACQGSPAGVWLANGGSSGDNCLWIQTHDVVVRYLGYSGENPAIATGPDGGSGCFEMASASVWNVVVDHVTARWYGNKAFALLSNDAGNVHNISYQWILEYEPDFRHPVGGLGTDATSGSALATTDVDFHHMLIANIDHRAPLAQSGNQVRWVSNIVFNWNQFAGLNMGGLKMDWIENKWVDGNLSVRTAHAILGERGDVAADTSDNCGVGPCDNPGPPSWYLLNNIARSGNKPGSPPTTRTNAVNDATQQSITFQGWEGGEQASAGITIAPAPASWFRASPLPTEAFPITADAADTLDDVLLASVGNSRRLDCLGNWVARRESNDARVIQQYRDRAAGAVYSGQFHGDAIANVAGCVTSMHDGIPDQWKAAKGLSLTDASLHNAKAPSGYTWLEEYLNGN